MRERVLWFLLVGVLLTVAPSVVRGDGAFKVIVNSSNPTESLTKKEVSELFLKKKTKWKHGQAVMPVDQSDTAGVRVDFSKQVHGRPVAAVEAFWQQKVFSGRDVPPPKKLTDQDVMSYVQSHPGAIGYVSAKTVVNDCKVIDVQE